MRRYIDKDILVAKIDRWRDEIKKGIFSIPLISRDKAYATFEYEILEKVKDYLDTMEVKEVFLAEEFYDFLDTLTGKDNGHLSEDELFRIAEYFFELGLKAQKGE